MPEIPTIEVRKKKETLLLSEKMFIHNGTSLYLHSDAPAGKSLFLKSLHYYLKWSKKRRNRFNLKNRPLILDVRQFGKLYCSGSKNALLLDSEPALLPNLSVNQNILLPIRNRNVRIKHKVIEHLQNFDLGSKQHLNVETLSRCEMKFIELIRATLLLPDCLLLDDFDLSLPETKQNAVFNLLSLMQKNGTIIFAAGKTDYKKRLPDAGIGSPFSDFLRIKEREVVT